MTVLFSIIAVLLIAHGIYQLSKYIIIIKEIKKWKSHKSNTVKKHHFIVFIPVLHEENNVERILNELSLQNYPESAYEVVLVTTQKEFLNNTRPNTIDILKEIQEEKKYPKLNLNIIHYPRKNGFKADQLDFAYNQLVNEKSLQVITESYLILFDADATLDTNTINRYNSAIEDNIELYQQPLLWFKNIDKINSPIMQSFAFLQTFFSISYEIPMITNRFFPWRLKYLMGNGICIKGKFIDRIGGFPDIIEDVRIGRLSSFLGAETKLVPGFCNIETAKNFSTYFKQASVWFFGCGLFIKDYLVSRKIKNKQKSSMRDIELILYGIFKLLRWLNKGLLHFLGLGLALYYSSSILLLLFVISLIINVSIPVLLVASNFQLVWKKNLNKNSQLLLVLKSVVLAPVLYMLNFVVLYYGLIKLIRYFIWGKIILPKTER